MARGYGRSLDLLTLTVLLRHNLVQTGDQAFYVSFDKDMGWTAWYGARDTDATKWYETLDSALLALLIGKEHVPGTEVE